MNHKLKSKLPGEINNLIYADNTILTANRKEALKSFWMSVKEECEKGGLKLNFQKTKIMAPSPITSWQTDGGESGNSADCIFLGSKIAADGDYSYKINRCLLLGRKAMIDLDSVLKSRGISVPTKVCIVKFMVSPVVMHRHESGTINTAEFLGLQGDQTHKS